MGTDLLVAARRGDGAAFGQLVEPYRRELHLHCYRMLGSLPDAEDATQDALLAAWRGLAGFEGRASLRTWLYRIATNRCLNLLRSAAARPTPPASPSVAPPPPSGPGEALWLTPYPDVLLQLPDAAPGPEARYAARESISLAFVTAVQMLPPRQRAVLVLRDVLGFPAAEVATMLDATPESVTSALKRARAAVVHRRAGGGAPPPAGSTTEETLVAALTRAFEAGDVDGLVALLAHDVRMTMPPMPLEYRGRASVAEFLRVVAFRPGLRWRLTATRANGQPAVAVYGDDPHAGVAHASGLIVLTLAGESIAALTRFDAGVLPGFGLPRTRPV